MTTADRSQQARAQMHLHLMTRVVERQIPMDGAHINIIEKMIERMRPAFVLPGRHRYRLCVRVAGQHRIGVAYDTDHACLLSAWWMRPGAEVDVDLTNPIG
mgnify:FL=1